MAVTWPRSDSAERGRLTRFGSTRSSFLFPAIRSCRFRTGPELLDAAAVAGHLVAENSMFAFLAAHRAEVFGDADYADLFAPPGLAP